MLLDSSSMQNFSVYVRKISLKPSAVDRMNVHIQLSVKQKFGSDVNLINIKNTILKTINRCFIMVLTTTSSLTAKGLYYDREKILGYLNNTENQDTQVEIKYLSSFAPDLSEINPDAVIKTMGDGLCLSIPLHVSFEMASSPSSLDIFAASCMSIDQLTKTHPTGDDISINNIVSEQVINDGRLNNTSIFFTNASGELYLGDVHQNLNRNWQPGRFLSAPGPSLKTLKTANMKIIDFRKIKNLQASKISLQKKIFNLGLKNNSQGNRAVINNIQDNAHNYVSDILYSKTIDNNLNFYFSFNYLEALKKNALYQNLYSNSQELLSSCDLLSVKILRRRVNQSNLYSKLTAGSNPDYLFDNKEETINDSATLINLGLSNPGILNFAGSDIDIDSSSCGLYEYGIEIIVSDKSATKLINISNELESALNSLASLLEDATMHDKYDETADTFTNSFLSKLELDDDRPWERSAQMYGAAIKLVLGSNYNSSTVKDIVQQLSKMGNIALYGLEGARFVIGLGQSLVSTINNILNNSGSPNQSLEDQGPTLQMPTSRLNQTKRTFKIKQFFQQVFDAGQLINGGLEYLRIPPGVRPGGLGLLSYSQWTELLDYQAKKTSSTRVGARITCITPNFINIGPERTNIHDDSAPGLHDIDLAAYQLMRANALKGCSLKFDIPPPTLDSSQTDLSNQTIRTIQSQIDLMHYNNCEILVTSADEDITKPWLFDDDCNSEKDADIANSSDFLSDTSKFVSVEPDITAAGNSNLEGMNLSISPLGINLSNQIENSNSLLIASLLENDLFNGAPKSTTNNFKSLDKETILKTKDVSLVQYKKDLTNRLKYIKGPSGKTKISAISPSLRNLQDKYSPPEEIQMVDTLLTDGIKLGSFISFALRYGFIKQVEYLSGYQISSSSSITALLKAPIWKPLTAEIFESAAEQQKILLCRLRSYSTYLSNFKGLEAPIYNEVFLLGTTLSKGGFPASSPWPAIPALSKTGLGSYFDLREYSISYDKDAIVRSQPSTSPSPAPQPGSFKRSFANKGVSLIGNTTYNAEHKHEYVIDADGNGTAKEFCLPGSPNICHSHKIINGDIMPAESKSIDALKGLPIHNHSLHRRARSTTSTLSRPGSGRRSSGRNTAGGY